MKKIVSLCMMALVAICAWGQDEQKDLIYTVNNEVIEAKVMEVSSSEIKYKEWNNQYGPMFILAPQEIKKIHYSNGTEKTYAGSQAVATTTPTTTTTTTPTTTTTTTTTTTATAKPKMDLGFQFNADLEGNLCFVSGFGVTDAQTKSYYSVKNFASGGLDAVLSAGVRVGKFLYTGVASGFLAEWGDPKIENNGKEEKGHFSAYTVPIYADVRVYAPTHGDCYPYVQVGIGGYVDDLCGTIKYKDESVKNPAKGGFYFVSGVGLEFKYLNIGAGYKLLRNADVIGNHGYVKMGVSLGKCSKLRK